MKKEHYTPPRVQKKVRILLERNFLGSLSKNATMETAGQEVKEYDYGFSNEPASSTFNTQWE